MWAGRRKGKGGWHCLCQRSTGLPQHRPLHQRVLSSPCEVGVLGLVLQTRKQPREGEKLTLGHTASEEGASAGTLTTVPPHPAQPVGGLCPSAAIRSSLGCGSPP